MPISNYTSNQPFSEDPYKVGDKYQAASEFRSHEHIINVNRVENRKCDKYKIKPTTEIFKRLGKHS